MDHSVASVFWPENGMLGDEVVIGRDGATKLVLRDGAVWSVDPDGGVPTRFVNASVEQFERSLDLFESSYAALAGLDEEQGANAARSLASALVVVDPDALGDPDSWWSVIMEQVIDGLL